MNTTTDDGFGDLPPLDHREQEDPAYETALGHLSRICDDLRIPPKAYLAAFDLVADVFNVAPMTLADDLRARRKGRAA